MDKKSRINIGLLGAIIVAISPWAIFFSRLVVEANLALLIFASGTTLLLASLKNIKYFLFACIILGISTHAYYSEQIIVLLLLPSFVLLFRKKFLKTKKIVILGLFIFLLLQLPHLITIYSGAFSRRFSQVSYINSGSGISIALAISLFNRITYFFSQYLSYFNPVNIFFNSNPSLERAIPNLGLFYGWFLIPFLMGIKFLIKNRYLVISKSILLLLFITPVATSLTADLFYPLRTLDFLWIITLIISLGIYDLFLLCRKNFFKVSLLLVVFLYSLFSLYISYFVLYKYQNPQEDSYGYPYIKLINNYLPKYKDNHIIIDSSRDIGIGLRVAYLTSYDPVKIQQQLRPQMQTPYYSAVVNNNDIYKINNIEIRPFKWADTCSKNTVIIGDLLSISQQQMDEYQLKEIFEVKNLKGEVSLKAYSTNPRNQCEQIISENYNF